jgi:nucleoside-diphosphate-sugar epimerase
MEIVLVTGAAGYIGSVLVRMLLDEGYAVRGFDVLNFGGESLLGVFGRKGFEFVRGDVRNPADRARALKGVQAVVHLAAIVGDPACAKQPKLAEETNWEASRALFDLAAGDAGISRFIFASTCSNYGKMQGEGYVDEGSPLQPVSLYAELKVKFENYLLGSKTRPGFVPTALRFATVYGISPRMRFDLTVNEFMRDAAIGRELVIFGEQFWRPYCHVDDLARACVAVLGADAAIVDHEVFNVGDSQENYQKKMIAEEILKIVPSTPIRYVHKDEDPRDYRVDFSKIADRLGFRISRRVPDGLRDVHSAIVSGLVADPDAPRYRNS